MSRISQQELDGIVVANEAAAIVYDYDLNDVTTVLDTRVDYICGSTKETSSDSITLNNGLFLNPKIGGITRTEFSVVNTNFVVPTSAIDEFDFIFITVDASTSPVELTIPSHPTLPQKLITVTYAIGGSGNEVTVTGLTTGFIALKDVFDTVECRQVGVSGSDWTPSLSYNLMDKVPHTWTEFNQFTSGEQHLSNSMGVQNTRLFGLEGESANLSMGTINSSGGNKTTKGYLGYADDTGDKRVQLVSSEDIEITTLNNGSVTSIENYSFPNTSNTDQITFPTSDGDNGGVIRTDGNGELVFDDSLRREELVIVSVNDNYTLPKSIADGRNNIQIRAVPQAAGNNYTIDTEASIGSWLTLKVIYDGSTTNGTITVSPFSYAHGVTEFYLQKHGDYVILQKTNSQGGNFWTCLGSQCEHDGGAVASGVYSSTVYDRIRNQSVETSITELENSIIDNSSKIFNTSNSVECFPDGSVVSSANSGSVVSVMDQGSMTITDTAGTPTTFSTLTESFNGLPTSPSAVTSDFEDLSVTDPDGGAVSCLVTSVTTGIRRQPMSGTNGARGAFAGIEHYVRTFSGLKVNSTVEFLSTIYCTGSVGQTAILRVIPSGFTDNTTVDFTVTFNTPLPVSLPLIAATTTPSFRFELIDVAAVNGTVITLERYNITAKYGNEIPANESSVLVNHSSESKGVLNPSVNPADILGTIPVGMWIRDITDSNKNKKYDGTEFYVEKAEDTSFNNTITGLDDYADTVQGAIGDVALQFGLGLKDDCPVLGGVLLDDIDVTGWSRHTTDLPFGWSFAICQTMNYTTTFKYQMLYRIGSSNTPEIAVRHLNNSTWGEWRRFGEAATTQSFTINAISPNPKWYRVATIPATVRMARTMYISTGDGSHSIAADFDLGVQVRINDDGGSTQSKSMVTAMKMTNKQGFSFSSADDPLRGIRYVQEGDSTANNIVHVDLLLWQDSSTSVVSLQWPPSKSQVNDNLVVLETVIEDPDVSGTFIEEYDLQGLVARNKNSYVVEYNPITGAGQFRDLTQPRNNLKMRINANGVLNTKSGNFLGTVSESRTGEGDYVVNLPSNTFPSVSGVFVTVTNNRTGNTPNRSAFAYVNSLQQVVIKTATDGVDDDCDFTLLLEW